uniref:PI3K/PI4K catalytic domain-containing protein n=1 Tax=Lotharella oceanica TaxID=641309 RepID=A0A7S2TUB7_9EUKA
MAPMLVTFKVKGGGTIKFIFKVGDDLRKDQMVMCIIDLVDNLYKRLGLDLCLTPYQILAVAPDEGLVGFVENSYTLSQVRDQAKKAQDALYSFLQRHNTKGPILDMAIESFVRSCAGYCVITYVLGAGDRHLDNLLITTKGRLFHIDFGYLFGADPKPLAPSIRVVSEMFEVMEASRQRNAFATNVCWAFNRLRSESRHILNLVGLMKDMLPAEDSNCLAYITKKLDLKLSDAQADRLILERIEASANAILAEIFEYFHKVATARR